MLFEQLNFVSTFFNFIRHDCDVESACDATTTIVRPDWSRNVVDRRNRSVSSAVSSNDTNVVVNER
jgi:hypothetical protein